MTRSKIHPSQAGAISQTPDVASGKSDTALLLGDQFIYLGNMLFQIDAVAASLGDVLGDDPANERASLLALTINSLCHSALIEVGCR